MSMSKQSAVMLHAVLVSIETILSVALNSYLHSVLLDKNKQGIVLGTVDDTVFDIILWRDHRAIAETAELNATKLKAHSFVGGAFSSEMEIPKLMWLKAGIVKLNWLTSLLDHF